jgi:hypothetical protein
MRVRIRYAADPGGAQRVEATTLGELQSSLGLATPELLSLNKKVVSNAS